MHMLVHTRKLQRTDDAILEIDKQHFQAVMQENRNLQAKLEVVHVMFKIWTSVQEGVDVIEDLAPHSRARALSVCLKERRMNRFRKEGGCPELVSRHGRDILRFIGADVP